MSPQRSSSRAATAPKQAAGWDVVDSRLQTIYSNNIRNNFGFLNRADEEGIGQIDKLFMQEGRKVFKEVCPAVATQINEQLASLNLDVERSQAHMAAPSQPKYE